MSVRRAAALAFCALLALAAPIPAAFAATVFQQSPCGAGNNACFEFFGNSTSFPRTLRQFSFTVPTAGRAEVHFHGSMVCANGLADARVVDLITQITVNATAVPSVNGPGGLRHAVVLPGIEVIGFSTSFNLSSTMTLVLPSPGTKTVYFRINAARLDAGTACTVYNLSFTAVVTP